MQNRQWPAVWTVRIGSLSIDLPLAGGADGFKIYAFDSMGQTLWNKEAARAFARLLDKTSFDIILTAESKSIALAEELATALEHPRYVVLRKSQKLYMTNPIALKVKSITTACTQTFYLGSEQQELLRGKRVLVLDDVVSTGGTMDTIFEMAQAIGFTVACVACVLSEDIRRTEYNGVPLVTLDHIPLPGFQESMPET
ncbi:MAG: adenine phosphoribosyltransferase [Oscillospiraceae bacterium]|jgi:adenine phosphoribosyltransferase|nr:adenine phosphoribosyltransferase [Oscillospiraceae bacterium]